MRSQSSNEIGKHSIDKSAEFDLEVNRSSEEAKSPKKENFDDPEAAAAMLLLEISHSVPQSQNLDTMMIE